MKIKNHIQFLENNQIWAKNINLLLQVMTQNYLCKNFIISLNKIFNPKN
jgi:hypothetical protein